MIDRTQEALRQMAAEEPELAARLVLMTLPAAAARVDGGLRYALHVDGVGDYLVTTGGEASVTPLDGSEPSAEFSLSTDAGGLASLAAGESPLRLMLRGRVRVRGKRRRMLALRAMGDGPEPTIADALRAGARLDADAVYRSLPYMIDPHWTRGHAFTIAYEVDGEAWYVQARDGERLRVTREPPDGAPDATLRMPAEVYRRLVAAELTPNEAMRAQLIDARGALHPVTLLGRWIDRAQGRDDPELAREERQRERQERRRGSWGGAQNGRALPAPRPAGGAPRDEAGPGLMSYEQLYALWERQNWRAHEIDFSVDRDHWATSPTESQENLTWSLGSFYIGEERVTADLAPFLAAAPNGEVEIFLATQLVDEARHAAFFDRFGAEVMALEHDDLRGRMLELQELMERSWFAVFDDGLRETAERIKARPDDPDLFVEGITTYHMVIEGVLAMTGQRFILQYMEDHDMYPGFRKGFSLVEQDEHRHIAFGVRFLRDAVDDDRERFGPLIERRVNELVPKAMHVFVPPYVDSAREWVSYGYSSDQIYGYAYRKLKRRMGVLGLEVPPAEELMPGPIASPEEARAAGVPV